jgi:hypothetical protein
LSSGSCDSRGLSVLSSVDGRVLGVLVSSWGSLVVTAFAYPFSLLRVRKYQVVQDADLDVTVRVVPDEGYSSEDIARIEFVVKGILGDVGVIVEELSQIRDLRSGKQQFVVSRAAPRFFG